MPITATSWRKSLRNKTQYHPVTWEVTKHRDTIGNQQITLTLITNDASRQYIVMTPDVAQSIAQRLTEVAL